MDQCSVFAHLDSAILLSSTRSMNCYMLEEIPIGTGFFVEHMTTCTCYGTNWYSVDMEAIFCGH